jgi:hypothetical protein
LRIAGYVQPLLVNIKFLWYTVIVPAGLLAKFKSLSSAIEKLFKKPAKEDPENNTGIINRVREFLHEKIPGTKERLILIGSAVAVLVVLGVIVMIPRSHTMPVPAVNNPDRVIIAPEELFIPEEPDFIPGVLLERERRTLWTADDAAQYWQDPLKNGEEPWREYIENTIDELMERIP